MIIPLGILAAAGFRPTAGGSYDLLETQVLTSDAASVTFSGLSAYASEYKHLQLRVVGRTSSTSTQRFWLRFNNDSSSTYNTHYLFTRGSSVVSGSQSYTGGMWVSIDALPTGSSASSVAVCDILDPFSASKNKTIRSLAGNSGPESTFVALQSGLWPSTAAISSIGISCGNVSWGEYGIAIGSRFSLYGLKV